MAIEWEGRDRGTGTVDMWTAVAPGPSDSEIYAEVGPFGTDALWFVAWRCAAGETRYSRHTAQVSVEGVAPTAQVARATAERVIQSLQQIAHNNPGLLQTLHEAASEDGNQQGGKGGSGTQTQGR